MNTIYLFVNLARLQDLLLGTICIHVEQYGKVDAYPLLHVRHLQEEPTIFRCLFRLRSLSSMAFIGAHGCAIIRSYTLLPYVQIDRMQDEFANWPTLSV